MFKLSHVKSNAIIVPFATLTLLLLLTGCKDIEYSYDIPGAPADCPVGTEIRSGGGGVVDRNGGAGVVDRDSNPVTTYCDYDPCILPQTPFGDIVIKWDPNSDLVLATRSCQ